MYYVAFCMYVSDSGMYTFGQHTFPSVCEFCKNSMIDSEEIIECNIQQVSDEQRARGDILHV